ncbi:hypothetical protein FQR65_LT15820 [Abscondita terminalis]|nr:hypothetical protein FQR65_LT15820 [Abscondita terminalis]
MTKVLNFDSSFRNNPCNICKEIPKRTPIYRCNGNQHTICTPCFAKLPKLGGVQCTECRSIVSKVKTDPNLIRNVTVEELFRLPIEKVNLLLSRSKEQLSSGINYAKENILKQWKPIKCPHGPCRKTVNCSSLYVHFNYEHPDVNTFNLERGKELQTQIDISIFEHGIIKCIGIIQLLSPLDNDTKKNTNPLFWLLMCASKHKKNSYVLYWITTHSDSDFQYTIETYSPVDGTSCATYCRVLDVRDNMTISDIMKSSNCMFLSYGSVTNLVDQNGKLNVCITIH